MFVREQRASKSESEGVGGAPREKHGEKTRRRGALAHWRWLRARAKKMFFGLRKSVAKKEPPFDALLRT